MRAWVHRFALAFAFFAMSGPASATSSNTDLSDLWWNSAKPGSGYQLVNTGTFVFATGFVYDPDMRPFWFSAELTKTQATEPTYTGTLFVSNGPFFGGPYDPSAVTFRDAGTMTFVLKTPETGELAYILDGVVVAEKVARQPLTFDDYSGRYSASYTVISSGCTNAGRSVSLVDVRIAQNAKSMLQVWTFPNGNICNYTGTYSQLGRMGRFDANYNCNTGEFGTRTMFEMTNTPQIFNGRIVELRTGNGCFRNGEVAGVIPR